MKPISYLYGKAALLSSGRISSVLKRTAPETARLRKALLAGYEDDRASISLPGDEALLKRVGAFIGKKQKLDPAYIVVVGIGGSNLGTIAVQEAVFGKLCNHITPKRRTLYADTVDSDAMRQIRVVIEPVLKQGREVLVVIISKSGGTTETIANAEVLINLVKRYKGGSHAENIVAITDEGSKLHHFADNKGYGVLTMPQKVGGRFSVFSAVGLFPLGMMGVSIESLLKGARDMRNRCIAASAGNPAAASAALQYLHYTNGKNISDLFLFSSDLESVGKWYRQLMGESVGKEHDRRGKKVNCGITPTVSIGTTDLHSMAQLYLGGPYDKFTTFVSVGQNNSSVNVPVMKEYDELVENIQGIPLAEVMNAILQGVKIDFQKGKRPYAEILLPDKSAYSIGQLLQFKMIEMMYLGHLLGVNPFDQPNVEAYKVEVKRILGNEG
ncbi:TPA: hypothetical protein HA361_03265 [Candidatus Woesearchaeota archaeon]|nr:hypothetical protein [Candidatus Woesearchaeota archaeon]HII69500.1 hypothetical protein [Candidatus Woesearchaeota archaeon]